MTPQFAEAFHEFLGQHQPLLALILTLEATVSQLTDRLNQLNTKIDESHARVAEDVETLRAEIADLRTKVTTPEDLAILDQMDAKADGLDPVKPDTFPEEPPTEEPTA